MSKSRKLPRKSREIIEANRRILDAIRTDGGTFPALHGYLSRYTLHAHMLDMYEELERLDNYAAIDHRGRIYWTSSVRHLSETFGGSTRTWASQILFLSSIGLLTRIKPDEKTTIPSIRNAYQEARRDGDTSPNFFKLEPLTAEIITRAEEEAKKYQAARIPVYKLTKADVIRVQGATAANTLYRDHRQIPQQETRWRGAVSAEMRRQVEEDGCTTVKRLTDAVEAQAQTQEDQHYIKKAMSHKRELIEAEGFLYRQSTREEREKYGTGPQWIITK